MSIVYNITRPLARQALKVYFKRIYFSNMENIPLDKPVILASNHPTAFIEPIIMACLLPKPVSYLVRGDFFANPIARKMLEAYNMIPIYRFVDGFSNLKKNASSFEYCYEALNDKRIIMIMVEGLTHHDKKLMPLQKGAARIVFDANTKYGPELDIQIVPVGINYTHAPSFRSEVMIDFGKPIAVNDYWNLYQEYPKKAIRKLTQDLTPAMKPLIIEIDYPKDTDLIEFALEMYRNYQSNEFAFSVYTSTQRLQDELKIANNLNSMTKDAKEKLWILMENYQKRLSELKINDFAVAQPSFYNFLNTFKLCLSFLPALIGWILNIIPFQIGHSITKRYIDEIEFFSPVRLLLVFVEYLLLLFVTILLAIFQKNAYLVTIPIIMFVTGVSYLYFMNIFQKWNVSRKYHKIALSKQLKLKEFRVEILQQFL